jgi:very-short-patch-repair endonuclease
VARKRLHPVHRGVYSLTPGPLSPEPRWMAAVLAGGEGAALSHWSGGNLLKLRTGGGPLSHVTIPCRRAKRPTITFHYAELPDDEVTEHDGIPVTTPGRTILDLAPSLTIPSLTRMLERAGSGRAWIGPSIPELVERYPRRAGTPKLRTIAAKPLAMTRSEVEALFLHLIDEWALPRPQMNISINGYEVDCVWIEQRLIVELDVYATHGSRQAFETDRLRDRALQLAGWTVIRVTDRQLAAEPAEVRRDLEKLLA